MRATLLLLLGALFAPSVASAVTLQDLIRLSHAGVADEVLIAMIERDQPVSALDPDQVVALKQAGVSEAVILAMIRSSGEQAAAVPLPPPLLVVVGHGPDRPNTTHQFERPAAPLLPVAAGYFVSVPALPAPCIATGGESPAAPWPPLGDLGTRYLGSGVGRMTRSGVTPRLAVPPVQAGIATDCDGMAASQRPAAFGRRAIRSRR